MESGIYSAHSSGSLFPSYGGMSNVSDTWINWICGHCRSAERRTPSHLPAKQGEDPSHSIGIQHPHPGVVRYQGGEKPWLAEKYNCLDDTGKYNV